MATTLWGSNTDTPFPISADPAMTQLSLAVADNGGTEFGVVCINGDTISVSFFDEQRLPSAARTAAVVTDGVYADTTTPAIVSDVEINAGGGLGYGVVWEEA